ncbi:hypothetical protein CAPTEDRAFT_221231 [Capitella teleta]|uniref:Uncharacterized protein n=1 Tax=Capitella teleta TaxID=283909 RepID=R7T964_CAPTE|nr:hypothetical protein CAPTEDRAFT_221231 [Capitella teleta]|eukprot:ELT87534.1 hypothetical protein CAPTEDRAFT_221231 [Capitella teleta]
MSTLTPAITTSFQIQTPPNNVVHFASSHAKILGVIQVTLGILSIIFHIPSIVYHFGMYMIGHGIWCGIFYIIAGGLTLGAAKNKNKCMIVSSLTLSILASVAASVQVSFGVLGGVWAMVEGEWYDDDEGLTFVSYSKHSKSTLYNNLMIILKVGRVAINTLISLFGLIAMIVCIIASCLSCKALCCTGSTQTDVPVQVITLEDGRVVNAVVLDSTRTNTEGMLPPAYEPIVINEKKGLI